MTYNLLYSVPTIYSNVWFQAYNTTKNNQLIPGLNQTDQAILTLFFRDNANMTYTLLYSVPAIYSGIWAGAYTTLENANLTYNLLYGTPAIYLNAWQQAMGRDLPAMWTNPTLLRIKQLHRHFTQLTPYHMPSTLHSCLKSSTMLGTKVS